MGPCSQCSGSGGGGSGTKSRQDNSGRGHWTRDGGTDIHSTVHSNSQMHTRRWAGRSLVYVAGHPAVVAGHCGTLLVLETIISEKLDFIRFWNSCLCSSVRLGMLTLLLGHLEVLVGGLSKACPR